jgi:hypothetical protein
MVFGDAAQGAAKIAEDVNGVEATQDIWKTPRRF